VDADTPPILWEPSSSQFVPVAAVAERFGQQMLDLRTRHLPAITHDGVQYTLRDIALHAPSEHAVGGVRFDAELQLVHIAPGPRFVLSAQSYLTKLHTIVTKNVNWHVKEMYKLQYPRHLCLRH
jgi:hypothetical protein